MVLAELLSCHLLVDIPLDTWGLLLSPYPPARNLEGSRGGLVCHGARAGVAARVELLPQLLSSLLPLGREPGSTAGPRAPRAGHLGLCQLLRAVLGWHT